MGRELATYGLSLWQALIPSRAVPSSTPNKAERCFMVGSAVMSDRTAHPVKVSTQPGKGWMTPVRQFHFQQIRQLGPSLEFNRHVIVKYPHPATGFDLPQSFKLRR